MAHKQTFILPPSLYAKSDLSRLLREIEQIEHAHTQAKIKGEESAKLQTSSLLRAVFEANKTPENTPTFHEVRRVLEQLQNEAPIVHISFAANPTPDFLKPLVAWFRKEVHPFVLLQTGLQPSIAAGCVLRTPNKQFDMTMRRRFAEKRDVLVSQLGAHNEQA